MNDRQAYQSLVEEYKGGGQYVKKLGTVGLFIQLGIIGFVNGWKHLEIGHYEIAAPLLFCLSICFLLKDFLTVYRIEESMAQMILDGVDVEAKNSAFGRFFHGILQSFNFTSILIQRSLVNALALICLGYLILQFINDTNCITISRWFLSMFIWIPSFIACKMYYDFLKVLDEAKEKVFAKQST